MNREQWGKAVRIALIEHNLTQVQLSKELNVSRQYIADTIHDRTGFPATDLIEKVSNFFGLELPEEGGENDS